MKKQTTTFAFVILVFSSIAQNRSSNVLLVRHDTTILKATECEWIIKSLAKNDLSLTTEIGKSVPQIIFQAIAKGKVKAIDRETNKPIPAREIYTWQMASDTMAIYDDTGNMKIKVVQKQRDPDNVSRIRIFRDWYFDVASGKLLSMIKWIELLEEIQSPSGFFMGYLPLCRIYY